MPDGEMKSPEFLSTDQNPGEIGAGGGGLTANSEPLIGETEYPLSDPARTRAAVDFISRRGLKYD